MEQSCVGHRIENAARRMLRCRAGGAAGWRLLCRAGGAAGWRTRSAKPPPYDRMIRMIRMTRRAGAAPMPGRCREASMPGWLQVYNNKAACSCPSSLSKFGGGTKLRKTRELGQILSRVFLLQSHLSKFPRRTWTRNLDNCWLPCYCLRGPRRGGRWNRATPREQDATGRLTGMTQ